MIPVVLNGGGAISTEQGEEERLRIVGVNQIHPVGYTGARRWAAAIFWGMCGPKLAPAP